MLDIEEIRKTSRFMREIQISLESIDTATYEILQIYRSIDLICHDEFSTKSDRGKRPLIYQFRPVLGFFTDTCHKLIGKLMQNR